jgi:phage tail-like protein
MRNFLSILVAIFISASSLLAQNNNSSKFCFRLKTDKLELKFQEITGISLDNTIIYTEGKETVTPRKLPGLKKYSNATCKKGMASNTKEMNDFFTSTKRVPITIELLDEQGKVTQAWTLSNAYIVKAVIVVNGKDLVIESMEIVNEGVSRYQ